MKKEKKKKIKTYVVGGLLLVDTVSIKHESTATRILSNLVAIGIKDLTEDGSSLHFEVDLIAFRGADLDIHGGGAFRHG